MYVCMHVCVYVWVLCVTYASCMLCIICVYSMCISYLHVASYPGSSPVGEEPGYETNLHVHWRSCSKSACTMYNCQRVIISTLLCRPGVPCYCRKVIISTLLCRPGVPCYYWREERTRWNWTSPTSLLVRSELVFPREEEVRGGGENYIVLMPSHLCIYVVVTGRNRSLFHCVFQSH